MFELPRSLQLLKRVAVRLRLASIGSRLYVAFIVSCVVYAAILVTSRFGGVYTDWITPASLGLVPAAALLAGMAWHRRPTLMEAARAVDQKTGTKDLFLTVALIEKSAGEYQALVARSAEERAAKVQPTAIVPFQWSNRFGRAAIAAVAIAGAARWLPQFDPFGKVEAAQQVTKKQQQLEESKKATEIRTAQLQKDESDGPLSEETKKAIENLKSSLNRMKPSEKSENLKELVGQQKMLGDKWRKLSGEKLKDLLSQNPQGQQFGALDKDKLEKWTKELQEGSTRSLQRELDEIKKDLEQLAKTDDPLKKAELEKKIKKKMKELSDFANDKVNSKPLAAALQRAMKQLEMAKMEGLDKESVEAAERSLDLTKLELKEIAQSAKDLKALEEALKAVQMAKQINDQEKLDGEQTEGAQTIEEYAEFYAQLIAQLGGGEGEGEEGDGEGLGGEGMGQGGKAPEDDTIATDFKTEQSKSAVTAGKVLLSVKTKGLSDKGDASKEYKTLIQKVKQGYSEAILQEQVPPGYHEGIKSYFDNLDKTDKSDKLLMPAPNRSWPVAVLVAAGALAALEFFGRTGLPAKETLVVYCAHDAVFAEEILRGFEKESGIPIVVRYDGEATKSLGFINLLVQEKNHPQCDVFWNNELLGTCELQEQGVLAPYRGSGFARIPEQFKDPEGHWAGFAARLRVYIVNTDRIPAEAAAIEARLAGDGDLTRVTIAQPLYGTTLTHYTVLAGDWGEDKLHAWHNELKRRGIREAKGNAATKNLVADGSCDFGFTDSDDFFAAKDEKKPVAMLPVRVEGKTICIPNSVAIIRGTPRLTSAQKLVDYLLSAETELRLAKSESRQVPLGPVDESQIPEEVRPLVAWGADGADLRPLLPARRAVVAWLKSEYLQ